MITKNWFVCCLIALSAIPMQEVWAGPANFTVELISTFDYPGSVVSTQPQKISDRGAVVGLFVDASAVQRGFVRFMNGHFSPPLVDPLDTGNTTQARGINTSLRICGDYLDGGTGTFHGFFAKGSSFRNYDIPDSSTTINLGLNNANDFCGSATPNGGSQSGFVSISGAITEFIVPGATTTLAYQINSSNQAAGYYIDGSSVTHGYYRDSDGSIVSPIDPAGSTGTIVFGNNDNNYIVGRYSDSSGFTHGFVFVAPDIYVIYDYPGSTFTSLNGINSEGSIVGRYLDSGGIEHGILARLIAAPNRPTQGTIPVRHPASETLVQAVAGRPVIVEPAQ